MTGSLNRSQHMAHVRSSLRLPLEDEAIAAAAAMIGVLSSPKSVHTEEVKAKAWRQKETGRGETLPSSGQFVKSAETKIKYIKSSHDSSATTSFLCSRLH